MASVDNERPADMDTRVSRFRCELKWAIDHYRRLAKRFHAANLYLITITGLTSASAAVLGLAGLLDGKIVGAVALIPGLISSFAVTLKLQEKANQHYRRKDALQLLLNKLDFEIPLKPTEADLAALSSTWADITNAMNNEWEQSLIFDWKQYLNDRAGTARS